MARLKDEVIDQIKSQVSLLRLVESQGHKPKTHGKDKVITCPFHQDDTASLVISPNNLFNCFGCGAAGSVIDWVMKTQGVSFRFACELLQKDISLIAQNGETPIKQNTTTKLSFSLAADHQVALTQVIDYYHETLKQCVEVHEYLASRGLDCPKLIEYFKLGYANRTLAYRLPAKNRKAGGEMRGQLQDIGILRQSGHEHFNGSLVVPVINEQGEITEVYGRKILGAKLRKGTAQHLYLPRSHRGVFNAQGLVEQSQLTEPNTVVILCEALIDAMTFWRHGFTNVTASYGTQGFTDDHLELFKRLNIKTVLIAYDNDDAGNQAASALAEKLLLDSFDLFRIEVPKNMDINSYACAVTPAQKSLSLIIRQALWLGKEGMGKGRMGDDAKHNHDFSLAAKNEPAPEKLAETQTQTQTNPALAAELTNVSPVPASPALNIDAEINDQEVTINLTGRAYRIRGLERNTGLEQLKINLLVKHSNDGVDAFHVDTLDLYSSKARFAFIKQASLELGVNAQLIKSDLGKVLLALEDIQAKQLQEALEVKKTAPVLTSDETAAAMELLQDSALLERIINDFEACGVVGERVNTLMGYLAGVSRKLSRPLAVMIQSSSAAGKSALMDAVLNFMPPDERVQYSAMTGQSLFYMGETSLKHKILAISEEEGAENASYALKLLQSEGEVTIASTGKNATTGNLETQEYRVEGPVMLFLTTTAIDIDEELLNRCLVLTVNESRAQTQAIHEIQRQRRTLDGLKASVAKSQLITLHQHAQQLLKPLAVVNPFANQLSFLDKQTRTRRDHEKYLTLIDSIALLHQHQRPIKTLSKRVQDIEYIEATLDDIAVANALASDVLGRTLDELPPQTRTLLGLIYQLVQQISQQQQISPNDCHFSRRQIREFSDWGNTQLKVHCQRLEDMEYLIIKRGGRGSALVYELAWSGEGENGNPFLMGLSCLKKLGYDVKRSGVSKVLSALSRGQVGTKSEGSQSDNKPLQTNSSKTLEASTLSTPPANNTLGDITPSYRNVTSLINEKGVMV
ncbi:MAG: toprim domain-containing protein [Psychrobium sp.]|nr:toprim domain-containing protein [Psychrobium sp.]